MAQIASPFVLVVDDDQPLRDLLTAIFVRRGYRATAVGTGEEALALMRSSPADLVILDVYLPDISGYDVCRDLRATFGERLPILFVSGVRTEPYDRVAGLRLGADDYIVKPFSPDELLARVDRFLVHAAAEPDRETPPTDSYHLTRRELEVLRLLAGGNSPREIASELSVSNKTVGSHIQSILVKLDVHTQAQAVSVAFLSGLIAL